MLSFLGYLVDLPNRSISFPKAIRTIKTQEAHGHHVSRSVHPVSGIILMCTLTKIRNGCSYSVG